MNGLEKAEPKMSQTFSCCLQIQQAADGCCGIASFPFLSHLHNSIILNTLIQKILKDAFKGPVFTCGNNENTQFTNFAPLPNSTSPFSRFILYTILYYFEYFFFLFPRLCSGQYFLDPAWTSYTKFLLSGNLYFNWEDKTNLKMKWLWT